MSIRLHFYRDPGLTQRLGRIDTVRVAGTGSRLVQHTFYVGTPLRGYRYAAVDDGAITLSVVANGASSPGAVLALSDDGFAGATSELDLPTMIQGGEEFAIPVHLKLDLAVVDLTGLAIATNDLIEWIV